MYYAIRILVFSALVSNVRAELQFEILVEDMVDNVLCFDPATCGPVEGHALVTNLANQMEYTIPIECNGPGGFPMAYQFVMHGDGLLPPGGNMITYLAVDWSGPGFRYRYSETYGPFEFFYFEGPVPPPFEPNTVHPGSGCICDPPAGWEWEACEEGPIQLDLDFVVPAGVVLEIEAGTRVQASPGVRIRVEGAMVTRGSRDAWVLFEGDAWGGIEFAPGATGELYYTRITGALDSTDGGALGLEPDSEVALEYCIIDHNASQGRGGGAFVADEAQLRLRSSTVSHNSAISGGNLYVESGGVVSGYYNLVTFGTPQTMVSEEGLLASNLNFSDVYPLEDPSQGTGWYCDPGYADATAGDFRLSFWNVDSPYDVNCTIDVATVDGDMDPDGTRSDMGALPFDQHDVLHPALVLDGVDRPDDDGGVVYLRFAASPNDGSSINPVSFYTVWVRYPGSEDYISSGQTIGAIGQAEYTVPVQTLRDSTVFNGFDPDDYLHSLRVYTHTGVNPALVARSMPVEACSSNNLAPAAVDGFACDGEWTVDEMQQTARLDLWWSPCQSNDFDHYLLFYSETTLFEDALFLGEQTGNSFRFLDLLADVEGVQLRFFIVAVDVAANASGLAWVDSPPWQHGSAGKPVPIEFGLKPCFPNPFNPVTTIEYSLATPADVRMRVYNLQGMLLRTLVEARLPAGVHRVEFNAEEMASGVYICHLQAGAFEQTRRMVLLK